MSRVRVSVMIKFFAVWLVLLGFWVIFYNAINFQILISGSLISWLVLFLYRTLLGSLEFPTWAFKKTYLWLLFFLRLAYRIVLSTARTLFLVITNRIKPEIVVYPCEVRSSFGRLLLMNSITLTPTTIAILTERNLLYIHHLYLPSREKYQKMKDAIQRNFDNPLQELLG